jgi:hypothetical protein
MAARLLIRPSSKPQTSGNGNASADESYNFHGMPRHNRRTKLPDLFGDRQRFELLLPRPPARAASVGGAEAAAGAASVAAACSALHWQQVPSINELKTGAYARLQDA